MGERVLNIGSASPLWGFGNPNDLKDVDVYERHSSRIAEELLRGRRFK